MKTYIVTALDHGATSNGHPSVIGSFKDMDKARTFVEWDIMGYLKKKPELRRVKDKYEVWAVGKIGTFGCIWDIHEIDTDKEFPLH